MECWMWGCPILHTYLTWWCTTWNAVSMACASKCLSCYYAGMRRILERTSWTKYYINRQHKFSNNDRANQTSLQLCKADMRSHVKRQGRNIAKGWGLPTQAQSGNTTTDARHSKTITQDFGFWNQSCRTVGSNPHELIPCMELHKDYHNKRNGHGWRYETEHQHDQQACTLGFFGHNLEAGMSSR